MSLSRRIIRLLDKRLARRVTITPFVIGVAIGGVLLSPLILAGALMRDLLRGRRRLPTVRLAALVLGAAIIEALGLVVSLLLWFVTGGGLLGSDRWRWSVYRPLMGWYTRTMLQLIVRVLGTEIEWRDSADVQPGPVVLIARHTSFFDALIPAVVLCDRNNFVAHHIVAHGLRYSPCIDVIGHRFPNRFIKRTPGAGSTEVGHIEDIGRQLGPRSAAIIFPEGTFRTPARMQRVVKRLGRRDPELAARATTLQHVLPPRSQGTLALLEGAPDADVIVCTNTGFEPFGSIKDIVERPYADRPIIIETWRIPRSEIPDDPDQFNDWLFDQYVIIDEWAARELATRETSRA